MMNKLSFVSDYMEGAHPQIMNRLLETNMFKTYVSFYDFGICGHFGVFVFFRSIHKSEYPFGGCHGHLHDIGNVGHLCNRLIKLANILYKGLNISDGNGAIDGQFSSR